jgi:competence protein ComEC
VYLTGRMIDHQGPPLNALAVAAVGAIGVSPLSAFDAGFILSFGATLGILLGLRRLMSAAGMERPRGSFGRQVLHRTARGCALLLAATVCAELALAPASAAIFWRVTFAGLILNFAAIPLMTIAQVASMATLGVAPFAPAAADACGYVAHAAATGLVASAGLVDLAPWLSWDVRPPAWWLCGVYYASCAVTLLPARRHVRFGVAGIAISSGLMLIGPATAARDAAAPPPARGLRVVFLDVGQGDATVIVLPDRHAVLVDTGGLTGSAFDIGERVLRPALSVLGVRRLDALVLTHGDPDHIGGAGAMLRHFVPHEVWEGVPVPPHEALRGLAAMAASAGASWRTVQSGDRERIGGVAIRVLHPPLPDWERQRVRNDDSIVLELRLGDVSLLLTGDIGQEPERALARRLSLAPIVIVKAPHHGSATSSTPELIAASHPDTVVFSAGRGNHFGHPVPMVVSRYRAAGAVIFRTDQDGAVVMDTDGTRVQITTWSGRRVELSR